MHCSSRNQALHGPLGHLQAWEAVSPCGGLRRWELSSRWSRPHLLTHVVRTPPGFSESPEASAVVASSSALPGFSDWCVEERLGRVHPRGWERGGWAPPLHHQKLLETSPLDHTERWPCWSGGWGWEKREPGCRGLVVRATYLGVSRPEGGAAALLWDHQGRAEGDQALQAECQPPGGTASWTGSSLRQHPCPPRHLLALHRRGAPCSCPGPRTPLPWSLPGPMQ